MDNYRIGNRCDVGKVRASNQDNMVTFECALGRVVVVCDGMGGRNGGEVASQIATEVIKDILQNNTFADPNEAITKSMVAANQAILHKGSVEPDLNGMGTTCVMAIIKDGMVYYGAVGDSRIYYITKSGILQLTKDQSYVQMLVDMGEITPEQATTHPRKNMITNAMGLADMTPPVLGNPISPEVGSYILLCTDGLTNMLSDQEINDVIGSEDSDFATKVQTLVDKANDSGGNDNITVQLIEFMAPYGVIPAAPKRKIESVANSGAGEGNKKSLLPTIIVCVVVLLLSALALWWFYSNGMTDDNNDILAADEPKVEVSVSKDNDDSEVPAEATEEVRPAVEESKVVAVTETNKTAVPETKKTVEEKPAPTPVVKAQPAEVKSEPVVEETSASGESEDTFDPSSLDEGL